MGTLSTRKPRSTDEIVYQADEPADRPTTEDDRVTAMVMASGSSFELFTALVALIISVIAISGYYTTYLAAIATVALGFSMLAQAGTVAARWKRGARVAGNEGAEAFGATTEMVGGLVAVVLGLLALVDVMPLVLLPAAALVLGVSILLGGPVQPDLVDVAPTAVPERMTVSHRVVRSSGSAMVMGGIAALVLGVIGATGMGPTLPLTLVALLCMAVALVLAGGGLFALFAGRARMLAR